MNDWIEELIEVAGAAADIPVVYSEPLVQLSEALREMAEEIAELPDDHPAQPVISAMIGVAESWEWYPPDAFGSDQALVDAQAVVDLAEALEQYSAQESESETD